MRQNAKSTNHDQVWGLHWKQTPNLTNKIVFINVVTYIEFPPNT